MPPIFMTAFLLWMAVLTAPGEAGHAFAADRSPGVRSVLETRHRHVVLQKWELSCGAAALATILRFQHGVPVTERSVALGLIDRKEYLANPDLVRLRQGFSLLDMKRFVDRRGYEGIGLGRLVLSDLFKRAPIIVPVNLQGFHHFVVGRGGAGDRVLLADPAFGNVTVSTETFYRGWIVYRDIGRVGFVVTKDGSLVPPGKLAALPSDFVSFRNRQKGGYR